MASKCAPTPRRRHFRIALNTVGRRIPQTCPWMALKPAAAHLRCRDSLLSFWQGRGQARDHGHGCLPDAPGPEVPPWRAAACRGDVPCPCICGGPGGRSIPRTAPQRAPQYPFKQRTPSWLQHMFELGTSRLLHSGRFVELQVEGVIGFPHMAVSVGSGSPDRLLAASMLDRILWGDAPMRWERKTADEHGPFAEMARSKPGDCADVCTTPSWLCAS